MPHTARCPEPPRREGHKEKWLACRVEKVSLLLEHGANVNVQFDLFRVTPLMMAAHSKKTDVVAVLLEHNADVDMTDNEGHTALYHAASKGDLWIVSMLLEKGANPLIAPREAERPSAIAMKQGRQDIAAVLHAAEPRFGGTNRPMN